MAYKFWNDENIDELSLGLKKLLSIKKYWKSVSSSISSLFRKLNYSNFHQINKTKQNKLKKKLNPIYILDQPVPICKILHLNSIMFFQVEISECSDRTGEESFYAEDDIIGPSFQSLLPRDTKLVQGWWIQNSFNIFKSSKYKKK